MIRTPTYAARRVAQTMRDLDNGPGVLAGMVTGRLTGRPRDLSFRVDGTRVVTPNHPGARFPVFEVFVDDTYRLPWFTGSLGPAATAVDIGGHVGSFSLRWAQLHPEGQVATYEAIPSTFAYLDQNVRANGLTDRVCAHNVAVAEHEGTLTLGDRGVANAHNGLKRLDEPGTTAVSVPCVPLSRAFADLDRPVDLVKLDAEGAEYDIILSSPTELWQPVRRVVMEYHDIPGRDLSELTTYLGDVGLSVVHQEPTTPRLGLIWLSREPID